MRSSSFPRSLILVASAALSFGACSEAAPPGGTGAVTNPTATTMAGTPASSSAGMTGGAATAGKPAGTTTATAGTSTTPAGTGGNLASAAAGGPATAAGGAGSTATAGGSAATAGASAAAGAGAAAGTGAASGGATFTMVHETILTGTGCAVSVCHGSANAASKLGLADKADAYMQLVGIKAMGAMGGAMAGGGCAGMDFERVKAGDPDKSLLVLKLEAKQTCGMEMPPGGMVKPEQLKLVRDWIMAGAKND